MIDINKDLNKYFEIRRPGGVPFSGKRMFDRTKVADFCNHRKFEYGAEIGVQQGNFSVVLFEKIKNLKLICVDPWSGGFTKRIPAERDEEFYQETKQKLENRNVVFLREESFMAVNKVEDRTFDFIYIDASHKFDDVMRDIIAWVPKVKKGGLIWGHDYSHFGEGVTEAVNAYTRAHHITEWYVTRQGREMLSYFWINK